MAYTIIKKLIYSDSVSKRIAENKDFADFIVRSLNSHLINDVYVADKDSKDLAERMEIPEKSKNVFSLYTTFGEDKILIYTRDDRAFTFVAFPHEIL